MKKQEFALGYKDVYLVPNKCQVLSRKSCITDYVFYTPAGTFNSVIPVIPANMQAVVSPVVYEKYVDLGLCPIMHRFGMDPISFLSGVSATWKAISIGIGPDAVETVLNIRRLLSVTKWPTCICIDVAHGHCEAVKAMIKLIKHELKTFVIAGNVTTPDAVIELQDAGADMIKVGIGPGNVCSTRHKTGFHVPMFTAIMECANVTNVPIIADGGISEHGDIAKALVAGASLVMAGSIFASAADSPAEIVHGKKEYYGSASEKNKGFYKNIEGFTRYLAPTHTIAETICEIREDLQSAISYAGGNNLQALDLSKVKYNIVVP